MKYALQMGLAVLVGLGMFLMMMNGESNRYERQQRYIKDHNCVRDGFAGKDALVVYRCDTGLWLETEIGRTN